MRMRYLCGLFLAGWLSLPLAAQADDLDDARAAMQKGDLRTAQINLRNAVRSDPQNAEAHFWLGRVSLEIGDPVAAEREARAARDRGFDARQAVSLLAQALLAQQRYKDLLAQLNTDGADPTVDAQILVARGYAQIGLGDVDAAKESFALAEKTAPDAIEPLLAAARLLAARGEFDAAQEKIDHALDKQPKSSDALMAKADLLRAKGAPKDAVAVLDGLLEDQPGHLGALLERAGLLIGAGQIDKAKGDLDVVLKAAPNNEQAIYLQAVTQAEAKDYKAADATLDRIANDLGKYPRGFFLQAIIKEQLGQTAQAEDAIRRFIARSPKDLTGYKVLARLQFAKGRPDLAAETLAGATASGQGDADTYDLLGRAYAATGRSEESVKAFQKAESLAPNDVGLQTRLATARVGAGHADSAVDDLERTLGLAPAAPQVAEALFFAALATADLGKAADAIAKVRAAQGDTPVVKNLEGLLKLAQLNYDGAAADFTGILKQDPNFVPAQVNLARVMAMQGKPEAAEKLLSSLLEKDPASEPALTMLVSQYVQTNRLAEALSLVQKAHNAQPANAKLTASLGELYVRAGKPAEALSLLDKDSATAGSAELLGVKAAAQLALGQKDLARETYGQVLKLDPSLLAARRALTSLLVQAGETEQARNVIKEGLARTPRNYQLFQDYAALDLNTGGIDAAVATAKQLQQQNHDFPEASALLGDLYMTANRPADAVRAYQDALKTVPAGPIAVRLSAAMVRDGQTDAATKMLVDWVAQHPADQLAREQLSDLYIRAKRFDDAANILREMLDKQPRSALALNNLAWIYQQQGDKRAQDLAQKAYVLAPSGQTADTLGWILVSNGSFAQAVPLLRQAVAQAGNDPSVQYHYAVALKDTGNRAEAIKVLSAVVASKAEFGEKAEA
ncbi:MAG TPA: XrtA/PEP-CTERM system TPR-repeat protein PrsT, partial [Acetobacteraceae bacterium]|nr:XrtA/PEP-CTERM system TPR-repeat protein PrsT [Acetobacteraceae bacterium]